MTIGDSIREYIEKNGTKKRFVAQKSGISDPIFSAIINNRRNVSVIEYYRICKALDVPFEKFIEEAEG